MNRVLLAITAGAAVVLGVAQAVATANHIPGPLVSVPGDFFGRPSSDSGSWALLVLAMLGLPPRWRWRVAAAALAIDLAFITGRLIVGSPFTYGNGPTIMLVVTAVVVWWRLDGEPRTTALRTLGLAALFSLAGKVAGVWLNLTTVLEPTVLDRYALLADRALGQPAWWVGKMLHPLGTGPSAVLYVVYIELTLAMVVVTLWQLRNVTTRGFPRHYLARTFLLLGMIGPLVYMLYPIVGPVFAFGPGSEGMPLAGAWTIGNPPMDLAPMAVPYDTEVPRNCMPSMHTAWALAIFLHTRAAPRWLRWAGTFWFVATATATLAFGYHYGIDLVVGVVLVLTVESLLREPERGWDRARIRVVTLGTVVFAGLLVSYRYLAVEMAQYPLVAGILVLSAVAAVSVVFYATWFAPARRPEVPPSTVAADPTAAAGTGRGLTAVRQ